MSLSLVFPSYSDRASVENYVKEHFKYRETVLHGGSGLDVILDFQIWLEKVKNDVIYCGKKQKKVPSTTYLVKEDKGQLIGMVNIRHELNESLFLYAGHIGCGIRPTKRNQGYGKESIRLALQKCEQRHIPRVLLTCDQDNAASAKMILANGGILENEVHFRKEWIQRYWIPLEKN